MGEIVVRYWRALVLVVTLMATQPFPAAADSGTRLFAVQLNSHGGNTLVTLSLNRPMPFRAAIDSQSGGRVTIDFDDLRPIPDRTVARGVGLVRSYHAESIKGGGVRLVLDLAHPAVIGSVRNLPAEVGKPPRATIELESSTATAMRAASSRTSQYQDVARAAPPAGERDAIGALIEPPGPHFLTLPSEPPAKPQNVPPPPEYPGPERPPPARPLPESRAPIVPTVPVAITNPLQGLVSGARPIPSIASIISPKRTIVIDAGHGGIDPGAESVAGYHEKEITLATARLLRRALEQTGRYKVVLTRDSDVYLKLHERVARARAAHGALFISLHADSVQAASERTTRGASIYTLSETASDAESDRYAQQENRADAIGGVDLGDQSDDVAGILVDLTVRETVNDGNRLAGMLVASLEHQGVSLLPTAPHRSAGFAVLKSPDIPSVLIEMGYLSDISDSRALADSRHQQQIANAIAEGVDRYFAWLQVSRS
jgi:N-acetylmuramoyl-L-alanine amidase